MWHGGLSFFYICRILSLYGKGVKHTMKKIFEAETEIERHWKDRRCTAVFGEDPHVTSIRLKPRDVFDAPLSLDIPLTKAEAMKVKLNSIIRVRIEIEVDE